MKILESTRPEYVLRVLCCCMGLASLAYDLRVAVQLEQRYVPRIVMDFALLGVGWLPFATRVDRSRSWIATLAAIAAIPIARGTFGEVMHDVSVAWPDHDRWCMPERGRLLTTSTIAVLLFLPLAIWSGVLLGKKNN